MEHYSLPDWVNFVRSTATKESMTNMQQHLDTGCGECVQTVAIWRSVLDFAKQEAAYEPPASALRMAEAYFVPFKLAASSPQGIQVAKLAFDSFLQAATAGVRGSAAGPRQLLYKCGDLCIDMRLEPKPGSNWVVLVGQVMDEKTPLENFGEVPVSLLSSGDKVSETTTNEFGEFHLGFKAVKHLQLFLGMKRSAVVVPLPDAQTEAA